MTLCQRLKIQTSAKRIGTEKEAPKNMYTPGSTNIAGWKMGAPLNEDGDFLLKMGKFQPAMLVYQRVSWIYRPPIRAPGFQSPVTGFWYIFC